MMKNFLPPDECKKMGTPWDNLMLGVNSMNSFREIVEDFWPIIVQTLKEVREIDIQGPKEEAWFHLRRDNTNFPNPEPSARKYANGRIEIFRIKRDFVSQEIRENLRNLPEKYSDVVCAGWWPCSLKDMPDTFFSFVQKLSVLRYNGIMYEEYLADSNDWKKALQVMMDPSQPWHDALKPWFSVIESSNTKNQSHYGHWFGLILTGWPQ